MLATDIAEEKFAPLADALIATRRLDVTEDHEIAALAGAQFQGAFSSIPSSRARRSTMPSSRARRSTAPNSRAHH